MPRYELFGRALASDIALPELQPAAHAASTTLRFERRLPASNDGRWGQWGPWSVLWWRPDGDPWVRTCRTTGGYRIQYCKCAEFHVDLARHAIAGDTIDCSEEMFRHFLVDQVVPLVVSLEAPVLHASSVAIDGRLVVFSGPGGAGKSTIATALARRGHALGGDDALLVRVTEGTVTGVPAYPGVRLWPDSETAVAEGLEGSGRPEAIAKQRFASGLRIAGGGATLTHVYILDPSSAPAIAFERLSPRDAVIELLRETYRLSLDDREALAREFDALAAIAAHVACWRLSFPRRLDGWRGLAGAIAAHVRSESVAVA